MLERLTSTAAHRTGRMQACSLRSVQPKMKTVTRENCHLPVCKLVVSDTVWACCCRLTTLAGLAGSAASDLLLSSLGQTKTTHFWCSALPSSSKPLKRHESTWEDRRTT